MKQTNTNNNPAQDFAKSFAALQNDQEAFIDHLRTTSSQQDINNFTSNLNSWQDVFFDHFQQNLRTVPNSSEEFGLVKPHYANFLRAKSLSESTISSQISRIKRFYKFRKTLNNNHSNLPLTFADRLKYFLETKNFTAETFFKFFFAGIIIYRRLLLWATGKKVPPDFDGKYVLKQVEEFLDIPPGTLEETVLNRVLLKDRYYPRRTRYGQKLKILINKKYTISTPEIDKELEEYRLYKCSTNPPNNLKRTSRGIWTRSSDGTYPSAKNFKDKISCFMGFCALPADCPDLQMQGMGIPPEKLTLALVTDFDIVNKFVDVFMKARSEHYNHNHIEILSAICSLLREETGYLYQRYDFAGKLDLNLTEEEWRQRCVDTRERLMELKRAIIREKKIGGENFQKGRDPEEAILSILREDNPLEITMASTKKLIEDVSKLREGSLEQAELFRDGLFLLLLQANPLRVGMFAIMKLDKNLYRTKDGRWMLSFNKKDFKNRHSLKSDYLMTLDESLYPFIEEYISNYRKVFPDSEISDYVFIGHFKKNENAGLSSEYLSDIIADRTFQYFETGYAFRPHSFRHIVTTSILKENGGFGIFLAAAMLHDKPETVKENYEHLLINENTAPYNLIFSRCFTNSGLKKLSDDFNFTGGAE